MNYSYMSFSCPNSTLAEALQTADNLGYNGFEPRVDSNHKHGIELNMTNTEIKNTLLVTDNFKAKLSCLATSVKIASKENLAKNLDDAKKAISVCLQLGIPSMRIFGGPIDENDTRESATESMAEAFDSLESEIGDENLNICIETHDSWRSPKDVAAVLNLCTSKHAAVNWDVMHTCLGPKFTASESVKYLAPYIKHVHMHDGVYEPKMTFLHFGTGGINHKEVLSELIKLDYKGYMSGEWINWNEPNYLENEIKTIKQFEEDVRCTK